MKKNLCEQFLSVNYTQILYKSLHNLKQVESTEEYTNFFYQLISRVNLNENEQQKVVHYLSGLKLSIQDVLVLQRLLTVSKAYYKVLLVEQQQSKGYSRSVQQQTCSSRFGQQGFGQSKAGNASNFGKWLNLRGEKQTRVTYKATKQP